MRKAVLGGPDLPQLIHVVSLVDPAMRVFLAEFDECFCELRREQQEAEQLGMLGVSTARDEPGE